LEEIAIEAAEWAQRTAERDVHIERGTLLTTQCIAVYYGLINSRIETAELASFAPGNIADQIGYHNFRKMIPYMNILSEHFCGAVNVNNLFLQDGENTPGLALERYDILFL
jgi:hypothetical protein